MYALRSILLDPLNGTPEFEGGFSNLTAAAICVLAKRNQLSLNLERNETGGLNGWQDERSKTHIDGRFGEQTTIENVAKHCDMSKFHFAHVAMRTGEDENSDRLFSI